MDSAKDEGLLQKETGIIDQVPRGKVVRAIDDEIIAGQDVARIVDPQPHLVLDDLDVGIDPGEPGRGRGNL